jgi:exopolysaccharide production protein ExoQ
MRFDSMVDAERARFSKMPPSPQSEMGRVERLITLFLFVHFILDLFSPWRIYMDPNGGAGDANGPSLISQALMFSEFLCILMLCAVRWKTTVRALWSALPILLLSGWIFLSARWAVIPAASSLSNAFHFFVVVLFACYVAGRYEPDQFGDLISKGVAIVAAASLGVMLVAPHLGHNGVAGENESAWRGALVTKNALGAVMSFAVVACAYVSLARRSLFTGLTFLACAFLLVMARSMTAVLAAVVGLTALAMGAALQIRQRAPLLRWSAYAILMGITLVIVLWPLGIFENVVNHLPGAFGRSGNLTGRTDVWRVVWAEIQQKPLTGYGYGFWAKPTVIRSNIWFYVGWETPHAHSTWLEAGLQLGFVGLALTALASLIALGRAMWLMLTGSSHAVLLFSAVLFDCMTQSVSETILFTPGIGGLFWWVVSYVYIASMTREKNVHQNAGAESRFVRRPRPSVSLG